MAVLLLVKSDVICDGRRRRGIYTKGETLSEQTSSEGREVDDRTGEVTEPLVNGKKTSTLDPAEVLRRRVEAIHPWFHSIALPGGIVTPGAGQPNLLSAMADTYFAMGIAGLSVLDVGAWDGYFSFEAERRGGSEILAVDHYAWQPGGPGNRAAIDLCREALGSRIRVLDLELPDVTPSTVGTFDVVLFNGIIYHVTDPVHHLMHMAQVTRQMLTVETWIDNLDYPRAVMNFFPAEPMPAGAPQNGWGPNSLLMHALLKNLGFETILEWPTPGHDQQRSIFVAFKPGHCFGEFVARHADKARPRFVGTARLPELLAKIAALTAQRDLATVERDVIRQQCEVARQECETARQQRDIAEQERDVLKLESDALRQSTSWRLTKPLRLLRSAVAFSSRISGSDLPNLGA
jgi:tRNA (mo5U34)-methyltransferase